MGDRLRRLFPAAYPPAPVQAARRRSTRTTSRLTPSSTSPGGAVGMGAGARAVARAGAELAPFVVPAELVPWSREAAMTVPTVSRARDLLCSLLGSLPLTLWSVDFASAPTVEALMPPAGWMIRPDPYRTRNWLLAWTTDDLLFEGRAYWRILDRYATGYPRSFERMPAIEVGVTVDRARPDIDVVVSWRGDQIDPVDVVEFLSPIEGLTSAGSRAMAIALELDMSAERYARLETPAGWLQERDGGEPSDGPYLAEQADAFAAARHANTIAALNNLFEFHESTLDPNRLQLTDARQYQALELARVANVPPYLVGAPAGTGMTYQNALQARSDLVDFGAMPYVNCIEQTLSGPNVVPAGQAVRLDLNAWLRNPVAPDTGGPAPNDIQQTLDPQGVPA